MAVKKIDVLELASVAIDGPTSVSFNADQGIEFDDFYSSLGFANCASKKDPSRTCAVTAKDVASLSGIENSSGAFLLKLLGDCGGANTTVKTKATGSVFYHNFRIEASAQGDRKTASIDGIFFSSDDTEPAEIIATV
jgi:hypothetical protein